MLNKIIILITLLSIPYLVSAAPSPWGIAINPETEQCTGFWGGDEYIDYKLPNGWVDYYLTAEENNSVIIQTEYGNCNFVLDKYEECCSEIGLEYIEDPGIESTITEWGKENTITPQKPFFWIAVVSGLIIILFIAGIIRYFYKKKRRRKTLRFAWRRCAFVAIAPHPRITNYTPVNHFIHRLKETVRPAYR